MVPRHLRYHRVMRVTFLGQAGLYLETRAGSILCDPWFNPAFFGSWFPFPANDGIDPRSIGSPDYLYVSHLHHDHFDPAWLSEHCSKDATVILPDYPVDDLRHELHDLGFRRFVETADCEPIDLGGGLRIMVMALDAPTDGPLGDSALLVDDGETRLLNMNDSRPTDPDKLLALGPLDLLFLQFSGAIWYPMVYEFPVKAKATLAHKKRVVQLARASATSRSWRRPSSSPAPGRRASSTTTCSSRTTCTGPRRTSSPTRRSSSTTSPRTASRAAG